MRLGLLLCLFLCSTAQAADHRFAWLGDAPPQSERNALEEYVLGLSPVEQEPFYIKRFTVRQRPSVFYAAAIPRGAFIIERDGENLRILNGIRQSGESRSDRPNSFERIDDIELGIEGVLARGPAGCGVFVWDGNRSSSEALSCKEDLNRYLSRRRQCKLDNGLWGPQGLFAYGGCVRQTRDGGKVCSDKSDCEVDCFYKGSLPPAGQRVTGFCAPNNSRFGCFSPVRNGEVTVGMCVD